MLSRLRNREKKIAVCVVERNALAAAYLGEILKRDARLEIISEDSILRSPTAYDNAAPVFALDAITLPGSLSAYLTILRSRVREARILLLGEVLTSDEVRRLPLLGIRGLVTYSDVRPQLRPAIRAIYRGDTWFAPQILSEFLRYSRAFGLTGESAGKKDLFTPRERLIIGLVERRLGNKEIAATLQISESTVKFHLSNVYKKLGVSDRSSAATVVASSTFAHAVPNIPLESALFSKVH